MEEDEFLASLEDLTGKVAVVTGGTQGIGQCTTVYLALRGATVYACAPDIPRERAGVEEALARIEKHAGKKQGTGTVYFHELDLVSVRKTRASARALQERIKSAGGGERLDILVCNAATVSTSNQLSPDGYDKTFAVNCLGHFVFVNSLLELMKSSANLHGEARITITSSLGYRLVSKLDYEVFTNSIPHKQSALSRMRTSLQRYNNTKLGELYLAMELDRRLREAGVENVFVNTIHPGQAGKTGLGDWDHSFMSPASVKIFKRLVFLGFLLSHSTEDSAKTQTFLSASKRIPEENVHGEYWKITNSWWPTPGSWMRYTGSVKEELKPHGADKAEWKRFWGFCDEAVKKVEDDVP